MKLSEIIEKLSGVDEKLQVKCLIGSMNLESNVYIVGQVRPSYPGAVLGDREPYLREKVLGDFVRELGTFGDKFQENDFLFEHTVDIDEKFYELWYFQLSNINWNERYLFLESSIDEIIEFRKRHENPEAE